MMTSIIFLAMIIVVDGFGNGINLQPSYYNNGNVTFGWDLMKKYTQIKTVRIEIEPDKVTQGRNWIEQARQNGYEVVATYHKCTVLGSDDPNEVVSAGQWWVDNYAYLHQAGDFTINMMNEWGSHNQNANSFSSAYNQAIKLARSVYSGNIILDIPGWGQETRTAAEASALIPDDKIIFSTHVYPNGWNQAAGHSLQASDMDELVKTGRGCIVGEFGTGSGPVDVSAVVNRAKELGMAVFAWAWNGDGGDLNMVSPSWSSNPTSGSYSESSYFWNQIGLL